MRWTTLFLCLMILAGCKSKCPTGNGIAGSLTGSVERLNASIETIETANETTRSSASTIVDTLSLLRSTPEDKAKLEQINESANTILGETIRIEEAVDSMVSESEDVENTTGEIAGMERELEKFRQAETDGRSDSLKEIRKYITAFFVAGFAMLAGGVFVTFWVNRRMGIAISGVGILTLGLAAASQYYLETIAQIGLWVLAGGAVFLIVLWIREMHSAETNKSAIKEIVELIEAMKRLLSEDEKKIIFGKEGVASKMTSPMTKHIVSKIRIDNGFKKIVVNPEQTNDS